MFFMKDKKDIQLFDYATGKIIAEKTPLSGCLHFIYTGDSISASLGRKLLSGNSFCSSIAGFWMKRAWSRKYIAPFIKNHNIDMNDFKETKYGSFNDFFIREIKPEARPIAEKSIIAPCDGKHLFFDDLSEKNAFYVKGQTLSLAKLIGDETLASLYKNGSMIISRLAPPDYHRYHFPVDATVNKVSLIPGALFSVSPIALRQMVNVLTENKRMLVEMTSKKYGNILQVVIGATAVGAIHITAKKGCSYKKGEELGYFSFGGSMVITLFQNNRTSFSKALTDQTKNHIEIQMNMGTALEDA